MKIYNKVILDWDGNTFEEESHEYYGPIAKCDMGADPPTQTSVSEPWSGQKPYLKEAFGGFQDYFQGGGADLYDRPFTAERDPWSIQGEQSIFDYIYGNQFGNIGNQAGEATGELVADPYGGQDYGDLTSDPSQYGITSPESDEAISQMLSGDPFRNPYTTQVADAFTQDMLETYSRDVAPGIRSAQIAYQPGGSSRGELVNARAEDDLNENILNMRAGFFNDAYNRSLDNQTSGIGAYLQQAGLGETARQARAGEGLNRYGAGIGGYGDLSKTIMGGYAVPASIGEDRQAQDQREIDEQAFRFDYDQNREYYNLQDYMAGIQGNYGGTNTTSYDAGVSDLQRGISGGAGILSILAGFA